MKHLCATAYIQTEGRVCPCGVQPGSGFSALCPRQAGFITSTLHFLYRCLLSIALIPLFMIPFRFLSFTYFSISPIRRWLLSLTICTLSCSIIEALNSTHYPLSIASPGSLSFDNDNSFHHHSFKTVSIFHCNYSFNRGFLGSSY